MRFGLGCMKTALILTFLVSAGAHAKLNRTYGFCFTSPKCQGVASETPMTHAQCVNELIEAAGQGTPIIGSWAASTDKSCTKPMIWTLSELAKRLEKYPSPVYQCLPNGASCSWSGSGCCSHRCSSNTVVPGTCY